MITAPRRCIPAWISTPSSNTFSQLARLRACGFDREVIRYVRQGVTYIGGCAGAHIATKNVEHVLPFDSNTAGITDFDALGLFNGILFCHYTEERRPYYEKALAEGRYAVYALTDDDALVINDDNQQAIGRDVSLCKR